MQQYFGIDLDAAMAGAHTVRHVAMIVTQLPHASRIHAIYDKDAHWTLTDTLLAVVINHIAAWMWGMSDKRKRGPKPKLVGPSWMTEKKRSLPARAMPIEKLMQELSKPRKGVK